MRMSSVACTGAGVSSLGITGNFTTTGICRGRTQADMD
jgi:hypothetical protein